MPSPNLAEADALRTRLARIDECLNDGRLREAKALAQQFVGERPGNLDGWIMLGRSQLELKEFDDALDSGQKAVALDAKHPVAQLLLVDGLMRCGRNGEALDVAKSLEADRKYDPVLVFRIGHFYTRTNHHAEAARCYERVRILWPSDRLVYHHLASAYIALGELEKAVSLFDDLLRKDPGEFGAYYTRATLRRWSAECNHVAAMEDVLASASLDAAGESSVCYAIAKELEDLKEWRRGFTYLKRGADTRKRSQSYDVQVDVAMMGEIQSRFSGRFFAEFHSGYTNGKPIFVLGMPRSGTTLVDRILSSHSKVGSVGESKEFIRIVAIRTRGEAMDEISAVRCSREVDFESVGRDYCRAVDGLLPGRERLLDKTPRNFTHIGLIRTALPNATVIHVRRNPADSCYALYKTLFREGYRYSYDLADLAQYYLAYLRLMDHWRRVLPGGFLDVDYEDLVNNQEEVSRRLVAYCGLAWEDTCLSFEKNASPSLTASAAQIRQPIYKSSVGLWRRYEGELQPLIQVLRAGGASVD